MTTGRFIFGIVMPAIVAGGGWIVVVAHGRYLRRRQRERSDDEC
jgi:hypothetical protein